MGSLLDLIASDYGLDLSKPSPIYAERLDRDGLAVLFRKAGFRVGAEIGVEQGAYSEVLLKANPGLKLFCVDAWRRYVGYRDHVSQEKLDGFCRAAEERLRGHDAIMVRAFSADAAKQFKRESLDFVYIDANHSLPYVIQDIWLWEPRVRPGGIVAGHDYIAYQREAIQCHVIEAVHAWTKAYRVSPWFVLGPPSSHPDPATDRAGRRARSWMWVKAPRDGQG